MAYERFWPAVSSKLFTSTGGTSGQVTLTSTAGLKVKQNVIVTSGTQLTLNLEVKRVNSGTLLELGPVDGPISTRTDLTAYTVGDGSAITANFQPRNRIPLQDINRAVYEEEPTVAIRVVQVDQFGNILGGTGGVASDINLRDGFGNPITSTTDGPDQCLDVRVCNEIPVDLDAFGDDDSVRVVGIDGATQRQIAVDSSGQIIVSQGTTPWEIEQTLEAISPQFAELAAVSIIGTTPGTATTIDTATADRKIFTLRNTLNRPVKITHNGSILLALEHDMSASFDFASDGKKIAIGDIIGVYYEGNKPIGGNLALTLI